jgi:nucleoid-associated protein YgaU
VIRQRLVLLGWLGLLVAVVAALTPGAALPRWSADEEAAAELVVDLLRLVTLALAWYLLLATVLTLLARVVTPLEGAAQILVAAPVRRLVMAAVGVSLAAAAVTSVGIATSTVRPGTAIAAEAEVAPETMRRLPEAPTDLVMRRLPDAATVPSEWQVRPGEHLWAVAEQVLGQAWGRPATDTEIDPYWRALVAANRSRLPDPDNPDLVYPGEVLTVPPPPAEPAS